MGRLALRGFYAIVDLKSESDAEPLSLVGRATALLAARPCMLQLRAKHLPAAAVRDAARALLPLCRAAAVPFCMNDRVDIALTVGADAVHLGQDDLPIAEARAVAASAGQAELWVGVSTHGFDQAVLAAASGADYIGLGPIFETRTKANPDPAVGLEVLRRVAAAVDLPVVAIGGISRDWLAEIVAAGASAAAVIGEIDGAPDRAAAARAVTAAFAPEAALA